MEELKPCPFCGREAERMNRPDNFSQTGHIWVIDCMCGTYSAHAHQLADTEEAVILAWNKRA